MLMPLPLRKQRPLEELVYATNGFEVVGQRLPEPDLMPVIARRWSLTAACKGEQRGDPSAPGERSKANCRSWQRICVERRLATIARVPAARNLISTVHQEPKVARAHLCHAGGKLQRLADHGHKSRFRQNVWPRLQIIRGVDECFPRALLRKREEASAYAGGSGVKNEPLFCVVRRRRAAHTKRPLRRARRESRKHGNHSAGHNIPAALPFIENPACGIRRKLNCTQYFLPG